MGGWEFPQFIHKRVDIPSLDDSMLVYYHDNLHILWSRLEKGYHFEWTFYEVYRIHHLSVMEMANRGIPHLAPINGLDKTHYFSEMEGSDIYTVEKKLDGIPVSIHKNGTEVKIFSKGNVSWDLNDIKKLKEDIKKLNDKDFILEGDLVFNDKDVKVYVRDIIHLESSVTKLSFEKRLACLKSFKFTDSVSQIDRKNAGTKEDLKKAILWASSLEGSEGAIISKLNENYLIGKSKSWNN